MTTQKKEALKISNVYLHRDGELELIKELENVLIRGVFTCGHSINILLKGKEGSTHNTFIQLDSTPLSNASSNGKSYLNISYSDINDCEFLTSDFVLYALHKRGTPPGGSPQHADHFAHNKGSVLQRREIKSTTVHRGRVATWRCPLQSQSPLPRGQTAITLPRENTQNAQNAKNTQNAQNYAKWLPVNTKEIFLGEFQFYGMDEENRIFTWHSDVHSKDKIIYHYQTKFVKYVNLLDKIKIVNVACGQSHALFLSQNKNCYAMGSNDTYQVCTEKKNKKKTVFYSSPQLIRLDEDANKKVKFIAAGYSHNLICTYQNEVYGWGNNLHGQLFLEHPFVKRPTLIFDPKRWHRCMVKKRKLKRVSKTVTNNYTRAASFTDQGTNQSGSSNHGYNGEDDNNPSKTCNREQNPPQEYPQTDKFTKYVELIRRHNQAYKKIKKWRDKNKFKVTKLCCGFSFSCLLLKNRNCYVVGKTNPSLVTKTEKIDTLLRINKKKKIDDIFCNFFNIILVDNLKIEKICPRIIDPSSDRAIFLHFNFPLKDSLNCRVRLNHRDGENLVSYSSRGGGFPDCKHGEAPSRLNLYLSYDNGSDEEVVEQDKSEDKDDTTLSGSIHPFDISAHTLWEKKRKKYWTSCQFYQNEIERELFFNLYNEHFCIQYNQCSIMLTSYNGQVLNLSPDNCALMRNIKLRIKIKKAPMQVNSDNVYVLFHFTDEYKNEVFKYSKGSLRRGGNYIYTKVPSIVDGDVPEGVGGETAEKHNRDEINSAPSDGGNSNTRNESDGRSSCMDVPTAEDTTINTHRFTRCNVYYSLGGNFYASSLPITIIKPDILNIVPNFVYIHDNRPIRINMLQLSSSFQHIYVTLSNPRLPIIRAKAYYDGKQGNFLFAVPAIPTGVFQRDQMSFITFHVFVSYNNVEYSQTEVILTISNVNPEGSMDDTDGGNGDAEG
ncbi:hypothetical protein C922_02431 [Plasmodium inui San Antonio 1]|uniref:Regulator of chromosome condensation n=1 Tax=Plasmodium inui San Antonio 1 TaxID=1237626 RepID=W7APF9_9APIC|nr:hypothetical protein C922_02431 [Plasmodium inui San Antonio 1]EUD67281.1 hypothetical protein C922_02431 [Plasmodium inui San Antonio 1]